jgi:hypothetical protein
VTPGSDDATMPDPDAARRLDEALATSRDDVDPLVGVILDAYRIDGVLGRGGMGVVYRGWDLRLDRAVAVKTIRFDDATARARFQREARSQARLRHRNVVPVHVVGEHAGLTYLVMDYVEGETLRALLDRSGKLAEDRALDVADAIAAALEAALARGLLHELLTGRRPERDRPVDLPGVRPATKSLVARLLAPSPDDRFDTYAELRAAIASARGPRILEAPLPSRAVAFVVDYFFFGVLGALVAGCGILLANTLVGPGALKHAMSMTGFTSACLVAGECEARWGTTPGKRLLRLRTTDAAPGARPSRARAIARSLVRLFPLPLLSILSIGPLMAVPKTPAFFGLVALLGLPALAKGRAALHDRVTNTRVVMSVEDKAP